MVQKLSKCAAVQCRGTSLIEARIESWYRSLIVSNGATSGWCDL